MNDIYLLARAVLKGRENEPLTPEEEARITALAAAYDTGLEPPRPSPVERGAAGAPITEPASATRPTGIEVEDPTPVDQIRRGS